ncbi:MAG: DUF169 domain-containing protein [Methanomassiliicoccales archaeon]|jgi:uncharacterized protein (DUF169 family)|nr:DUF169 domain-containing protein [Methanomassiliicoccales archaeon]
MDYSEASKKLVSILGLKYEPVAVTLIKNGQLPPDGYKEVDGNLRHCQSIMRARKGEVMWIPASKHACPVGASALGIVATPEKVASGEFHYNLGMFSSADAAKRMIDARPTLPLGSVIGTVVSPLSKAKVPPDVVVVVGTPEQLYWILPVAATFEKGGRVTINTAAMQATCVDSTIIPYLTGEINVSLGCFGCRRSTDIAPEEMYAGIPANKLEEVIRILEKLASGPIPKSRTK